MQLSGERQLPMSWIGNALMVMAFEVYGLSSESKVDLGKLGPDPLPQAVREAWI